MLLGGEETRTQAHTLPTRDGPRGPKHCLFCRLRSARKAPPFLFFSVQQTHGVIPDWKEVDREHRV